MNQNPRIISTGIVALALALTWPLAARAIEQGASTQGVPYVSGGVSDEELDTLRADRPSYSFWLVTAARGSGAYLTDVAVRITEAASGKLVLEHTMDGPWLFVDLPPGRYKVEATCDEARGGPQTRRTTTQIVVGDHRQSVLYFDTGDEVGTSQQN